MTSSKDAYQNVMLQTIKANPAKISFADNLPSILFKETSISKKEMDSNLFDLYLMIEDYLKKSESACLSSSGDLVGFKS
jgi:hypothetical protein